MDTTAALSNREMAAVLFNIATLLKSDPEANPYRIAAYERAGRAMMALRKEAGNILARKQQITFPWRRHIGKKLQAKIREMATSGDLAQFEEMLAAAPTYIAELMAGVPGMGPTYATRAHNVLGISTRDELVRAARDGRLLKVPGFGPKRVADIAALSVPGEVRQLALLL